MPEIYPQWGQCDKFPQRRRRICRIGNLGYCVGISEEDLAQLFQITSIFPKDGNCWRGKTGLGLILCKDLVEKNGGTIWCESEIGKGTTFSFILPKANVA